MIRRKFFMLAAAAAVLLGAGLWLAAHRSNQQSDLGGGAVFADLKAALGDITEIRLSRGDGSRTTLRRAADGWTVVERQYTADPARVREFLLNLVNLKSVERKTSDPANYAKLGVEAPESPTAASTLLEVVAPKKTWALIVGKSAEGRAVYVRKPSEAASALAQPAVVVDPDQKRWLDRLLTDIPGSDIHEVAVQPASGPGYSLRRAKRGDTDLTLSPVPKGRTAMSAMSLSSEAESLAAFNFDDVHAPGAPPVTPTDHATFRTFDGQVIELAGHRDGQKAFVSVTTSRDAALAAQFPAATPATPDKAAPAASGKPSDHAVERLAARAKGVEFEIPVYKYEALFKPLEELLEKPPAPAAAKKPAPAARNPAPAARNK